MGVATCTWHVRQALTGGWYNIADTVIPWSITQPEQVVTDMAVG